jgi:DNA-binding transcriptional LysR family regulator
VAGLLERVDPRLDLREKGIELVDLCRELLLALEDRLQPARILVVPGLGGRGDQRAVAAGIAHRAAEDAEQLVIAIRLTPAGRRLLAHAKRLTLTVAGTLTPAGSKAISAQLTVMLTRRHAA